MNRENARTVVSAIKIDTERHDQCHWTNIAASPGYESDDGDVTYSGFGTPKVKESEGQVINCGTTACFAGHTGFIFAPVGTKFYKEHLRVPGKSLYTYETFADEVLELTNFESAYLYSAIRSLDEIDYYVEASDEEQNDIMDNYNNDLL